MEVVLKQILKQSNKIGRILAKIIEKHPQTSEQIDLALYSVAKIQKTANKYITNANSRAFVEVFDEDLIFPKKLVDPVWETAVQNIEGFKNATHKLQRKINILINESSSYIGPQQYNSGKSKSLYEPIQSIKKQGKRPENFEERGQSAYKTSRYSPKQDVHDISERLQEDSSEINLSEIDANIMQLTKKIRNCVQNDDQNEEYQDQYYL